MWFWSLGEHMPYPLYMQFWGLQGTCHAIIVCSVWACGKDGIASSHAVLELVVHMTKHYYMQVWSAWGIYHSIIKCNFWACDTYAMPSTITSYWFMLVCTTLDYFIFYCTLSLVDHMGPEAWCLQAMCHVLITCSPGAWLGICHSLITWRYGACNTHAIIKCNFWACTTYAMPSLQIALELA